jgi:hypothetical protein
MGGSSPLTFIRSSNDGIVFQRPELSRIAGSPLLERVDVRRGLVGDLPVEDLDAVEAEPRGILDHLLDRVLRRAHVPVRVRRYGDPDARLRAARRCRRALTSVEGLERSK